VISCDTYYYGLAQDLGIDNIFGFISQFGFGKRTGIDIDGEASGLLPSQEWKMRRFKQKWFAGDTISVGIGQGYNLATPVQLAYATSILANSGVVFRPHIVRYIQNSQTNALTSIEVDPVRTVALKRDTIELVKKAMVDVTRPGGTAAGAGAGSPYAFAGKTGTAQVIGMKQNEKYDERRVHERHRDHALFIAYAPADAPTIALAVLVENGGHGGSAAAPIARQVFDFYLLGKEPEVKPGSAEEPEGTESD
jgi:penicillin-binding protein 2